jgi:inorganic pyrophosphatase
MEQITRFFTDYKILEKKAVVVSDFKGKGEAHKAVMDAVQMYKDVYPDSKLDE